MLPLYPMERFTNAPSPPTPSYIWNNTVMKYLQHRLSWGKYVTQISNLMNRKYSLSFDVLQTQRGKFTKAHMFWKSSS